MTNKCKHRTIKGGAQQERDGSITSFSECADCGKSTDAIYQEYKDTRGCHVEDMINHG